MKRLMSMKLIGPGCGLALMCGMLLIPGMKSGSSYAWWSPGVKRVEVAQPGPPAMTGRQGERGETPQFLVVYATTYGFEPNEAVVKQGDLVISLRNRSGLRSSRYQLRNRQGEAIGQTLVPGQNNNLKVRNTLPPGEYVIGENSHPEWTFKLTVQP